MNKITPMQLAALMLCGRCVSMMTYSPIESENAFLLMIGILISTLIQVILIIPIVLFQKKFQSCNPCTLAVSRSRPIGIIITLFYLLFFMMSAFLIIGNFVYLMDFYLSNFLPRFAMVAVMVLAALYIGKMNVSVFGKSASLVLTIFLLFTLIIIFSSGMEFHFENFYLTETNLYHPLINEIKKEIARNHVLLFLVFLLPDIKGNAASCGFTYLGLKLVLVELVLSFIIVILGDFAMISKLPFFYLAAYSHTAIVERYDAVFMAMWVIMSLLKLSVYFHCSGRCLKVFVPKLSKIWAIAITGTIAGAMSLVWLLPHKWESISHYSNSFTWIFVILLVTVIPFIMLFMKKEVNPGNEKS